MVADSSELRAILIVFVLDLEWQIFQLNEVFCVCDVQNVSLATFTILAKRTNCDMSN